MSACMSACMDCARRGCAASAAVGWVLRTAARAIAIVGPLWAGSHGRGSGCVLLIRQPHKAQRCTAWFGLRHEVGMTHAMVHGACSCTLCVARCTFHVVRCTLHVACCALHVACRTLHVARCTCSATDRATALYGSDGFSEQMRFTCVRQHSTHTVPTSNTARAVPVSVPALPSVPLGASRVSCRVQRPPLNRRRVTLCTHVLRVQSPDRSFSCAFGHIGGCAKSAHRCGHSPAPPLQSVRARGAPRRKGVQCSAAPHGLALSAWTQPTGRTCFPPTTSRPSAA